MYHIVSDLSREEHLSELKQRFGSPLRIFDERVCGFVIGPFFSAAYHSPYEWNRRITSECNRAWGYVKQVDGRTQVRYIRGKGQLSPFWLTFYYLMWIGILIYVGLTEEIPFEDLFIWQSWGAGVVISILICGVSAFQSSITDAGIDGEREIMRLLMNPKDYYC